MQWANTCGRRLCAQWLDTKNHALPIIHRGAQTHEKLKSPKPGKRWGKKKSVRNTTERKKEFFFPFSLKKGASLCGGGGCVVQREKKERERTHFSSSFSLWCWPSPQVLNSAPTRLYSTVLFLSFLVWVAVGRDAIRTLATLNVYCQLFFGPIWLFALFRLKHFPPPPFPSQVISLYIHSISSFFS